MTQKHIEIIATQITSLMTCCYIRLTTTIISWLTEIFTVYFNADVTVLGQIVHKVGLFHFKLYAIFLEHSVNNFEIG